ncbi:hypothetical protein TNCV_527071 [Trichonephila clavipes]|nr:hypothetical protein TNCV_527071 [Trichonephila clavipes]
MVSSLTENVRGPCKVRFWTYSLILHILDNSQSLCALESYPTFSAMRNVRYTTDYGHQKPKERQCLQTTIFMQDGATPRIGRQVKALLSANFGDNRDYPGIFRMHGLITHLA